MRTIIIILLIFTNLLTGVLLYDQFDSRIRSNYEQILDLVDHQRTQDLPQLMINRATVYTAAGDIAVEKLEVN